MPDGGIRSNIAVSDLGKNIAEQVCCLCYAVTSISGPGFLSFLLLIAQCYLKLYWNNFCLMIQDLKELQSTVEQKEKPVTLTKLEFHQFCQLQDISLL